MRRILVGFFLVFAACAESSEATAGGEKAVCDSFQEMVNHLRAGRSQAAVAEMRGLEELAGRTDNQVMSMGGQRFSAAVNKRVGDSEVSAEQALDEGRLALETGGAALSRIYKECNRLGHEVDLPSYDQEGKRVPGS